MHAFAKKPTNAGHFALRMQIPVRRGLVAIAWILLTFTASSARSPTSAADELLEAEDLASLRCGPNCLFMLASMHGRNNVELESLYSLPTTREGVSLLDLKKAARGLGISASVRRFDVGAVHKMPLPAIVQLKPINQTAHFSIVYKVEGPRVWLIDGTSAERFVTDNMPSMWTGYALVRDRSYNLILAGGACLLVVAFYIVVISRRLNQIGSA